jgi:hypothetical protein
MKGSMVRLAVWALVAAGLLGLLRAVATFVFYDDLLGVVIEESEFLSGLAQADRLDAAEQFAPAYRPIALISGAFFGLLLFGCALGVARRYGSWARWVGVVVSALTVLGGLVVLAQPSVAVVTVTALLTAGAALVALVALLSGQVGAHLAERQPVG